MADIGRWIVGNSEEEVVEFLIDFVNLPCFSSLEPKRGRGGSRSRTNSFPHGDLNPVEGSRNMSEFVGVGLIYPVECPMFN